MLLLIMIVRKKLGIKIFRLYDTPEHTLRLSEI